MPAVRTAHLSVEPDYISPSGVAEIRLLLQLPAGELTHARVPPGAVSLPSRVYPNSEWFFVISGRGQLWFNPGGGREATTIDLVPDRSVRIPPATPFQYCADEAAGLEIVLAALPQWHPTYHGVLHVPGGWQSTTPTPPMLDTRGQLLTELEDVRYFDPDPDDQTRSYMAPDGSHIMTMGSEPGGGLAICTLAPGGISRPVRHRSVEEIWFVYSGYGRFSRRHGNRHAWTTTLGPGTAIDVGTGLTFQFRADGAESLRIAHRNRYVALGATRVRGRDRGLAMATTLLRTYNPTPEATEARLAQVDQAAEPPTN